MRWGPTALREALGLDQEEMGLLLGVDKRTMVRVESPGAQPKGSLGVAVVLLQAIPLQRLRAVVPALARDDGAGPSMVADGLAAKVLRGAARVAALMPSQPRATALDAMTLADILDVAWGRGRPWVYWATSAGTAEARTLELANQDGIVARSLTSNQENVHPYLYRLHPGDRLLLCHNGVPLEWYRLRSGEVPARAGDISASALEKLPPVFRVLPRASPLGKALAKDGYRAADGLPAATSKSSVFTALAVEHLARPPYAEPPEPRRAGDRFTVTPYFKRGPKEEKS